VPWRYADNLLVLDNKVEAATGTAIRACGWYVLHFHVLTSNKKNLVLRYINIRNFTKKMINSGGFIVLLRELDRIYSI
jgi:hypothetical protein